MEGGQLTIDGRKNMGNKLYVRLFICFMIFLTILAIYRSTGIYARKQSAVTIDLVGGRYLHTVYLGSIEDKLYYAVASRKNNSDDIRLVCADDKGNLIFQSMIKNGSSFGTTMINDRIYMPVDQTIGGKMEFGYHVFDLNGNYLTYKTMPGRISGFIPIKDQIYAIVQTYEKYFNTYLCNINNPNDKLEFGSDYSISSAYVLQDESVILFGQTGYKDDKDYVHMTGAKICRIDGDKILWNKSLSERLVTYAVSDSNIIVGTSSGNIFSGVYEEAYLLDFDGNVKPATGTAYSKGLKSLKYNYIYEFRDFYSNNGYWDIQLSKYRHRSSGNSNSLHEKDYLLRLNNDGTYYSRQQLRFTDGRDIIGILESKSFQRTFLTAHPIDGKLELEIFLEK